RVDGGSPPQPRPVRRPLPRRARVLVLRDRHGALRAPGDRHLLPRRAPVPRAAPRAARACGGVGVRDATTDVVVLEEAWVDASRGRGVPVRIYAPAGDAGELPVI